MKKPFDPIASLADLRHEFGEHGGVNMSIETSTTFTVLDPHQMPELFAGHVGPDTGAGCYLYGRHFNPTVYVLGRQLAAIEGAEAAYCTASGLGAIAPTLMQLCGPGDHIVSSGTIYGGTFALLHDYLPLRTGVTTTFVDCTDLTAVEAAIRPGTKVVYVETLSNPTLTVGDIPKLAEIAHRHGAKLVVDNTFSVMCVSPCLLGADIVVHSLTKYINGASDVIAGAVCGSKEFIMSLMDVHTGSLMLLGPTMDPRSAFEVSMRLPHLGMRMKEHSRRGQVFAERLVERGLPVRYPGLADHAQHETMKAMLNDGFGFGGIFGLDLDDPVQASKLIADLQNEERFGYIAVSLGYFDSLMSMSAESTSSELDEDSKRAAGIKPGYLRISLGYTGDLEQRWQQMVRSLERCGL